MLSSQGAFENGKNQKVLKEGFTYLYMKKSVANFILSLVSIALLLISVTIAYPPIMNIKNNNFTSNDILILILSIVFLWIGISGLISIFIKKDEKRKR